VNGGADLFAAAWSAVDAALDWERLGVLHCHEGGETFFGPDDREALFDAGLLFVEDLQRLLEPDGRSLWVGASVAELVPMLVERFVLDREVLWFERDVEASRLLDAALAVAAERCGHDLPRPDFRDLAVVPPGSCDHLWLVSVLNDPEAFPALHDHLYQRTGELATGTGDLERELALARQLVGRAVDTLRVPALLTTTDEELPVVVPCLAARGLALAIPETARLSAVVGDPVRHCRLREA